MAEFFFYSDEDIIMQYRRDELPVPSDYKMHTHETYELYYFADGKGVYKIEGAQYPLERGDLLIMRPAEAHYIDIDPAKPYIRFSINFGAKILRFIDPDGHLLEPFHNRESGSFNRYRAADFPGDAYRVLIENLIADSENRRVQILSNLFALLNELSVAFRTRGKKITNDTLDYRIISYINSRITEKITLDDICSEFYISKPQLCRIFKNATGSTVWDYITVKRLVAARRLIQSGTPPTKAYLQCGYNDYSAFYRAHRKKYGISPTEIYPQSR